MDPKSGVHFWDRSDALEFDALLRFHAVAERVLHLFHGGDEVGGLDQGLGAFRPVTTTCFMKGLLCRPATISSTGRYS